MTSGSGFSLGNIFRSINKVVSSSIQNKIQQVAKNEAEKYVRNQIDGFVGGSSLASRNARRMRNTFRQIRNTGNQIQSGINQILPRSTQAQLKDAATNAAVSAATSGAGAGRKQGRIILPNSELIYGDYAEFPSSYLEPNNILYTTYYIILFFIKIS
jgi:hypothetical protein